MNDPKLNRPIYRNKKYLVYLDTDNSFEFKNKREAQDFIVRVQHEVSESILLITESRNDLQSFYSMFFLGDKDYEFKFKVKASIEYIDNRLEWIGEHSGTYVNYTAMMFNNLRGCFTEVLDGYARVMRKAAERKDTLTKRRCMLRSHLLKLYESELLTIAVKPIQKLKLKISGKK